MILATLQKLHNNVGNLGKIIVATGFELLPKLQKIAQSGHSLIKLDSTKQEMCCHFYLLNLLNPNYCLAVSNPVKL